MEHPSWGLPAETRQRRGRHAGRGGRGVRSWKEYGIWSSFPITEYNNGADATADGEPGTGGGLESSIDAKLVMNLQLV